MRDFSAIKTVRLIRIVLAVVLGDVSDRPGNPTGPRMEAGSTADRLSDHVLQRSDLLTGSPGRRR
jgi:hypothetical protein